MVRSGAWDGSPSEEVIEYDQDRGNRIVNRDDFMEIFQARTVVEIEEVRILFREYETFLNVDLCFQGFEEELAGLPGMYAPPDGALLIAVGRVGTAGCIALRKLGKGICEMKRLYVRPAFRGLGLGRKQANSLVNTAIDLGYSTMRLDTLDRLKSAMILYESMGFIVCDTYYENPLPGVVYWELDLAGFGNGRKGVQ
jgi:GNAT superfamily N-acetyltransferase